MFPVTTDKDLTLDALVTDVTEKAYGGPGEKGKEVQQKTPAPVPAKKESVSEDPGASIWGSKPGETSTEEPEEIPGEPGGQPGDEEMPPDHPDQVVFYTADELKSIPLDKVELERVPESARPYFEFAKSKVDSAKEQEIAAQEKFREAANMRKITEQLLSRNVDVTSAAGPPSPVVDENINYEDELDPTNAPYRRKLREMEQTVQWLSNVLSNQNRDQQGRQIQDRLLSEAKKAGLPEDWHNRVFSEALWLWELWRDAGNDGNEKLTPASIVESVKKEYDRFHSVKHAMSILEKNPTELENFKNQYIREYLDKKSKTGGKALPVNREKEIPEPEENLENTTFDNFFDNNVKPFLR